MKSGLLFLAFAAIRWEHDDGLTVMHGIHRPYCPIAAAYVYAVQQAKLGAVQSIVVSRSLDLEGNARFYDLPCSIHFNVPGYNIIFLFHSLLIGHHANALPFAYCCNGRPRLRCIPLALASIYGLESQDKLQPRRASLRI